MTLNTLSVQVGAGEWEIGLVVIENRIPVIGRVTGLACRGEAGRQMIRIRSRVVINTVAGEAFRRSTRKLSARVTLLAGRRQVRSGQRKSGGGVIEA